MPYAGVSVISDGKLQSASVVVCGAASGYRLFIVDGYSRSKENTPNGKSIKSRPFRVGGYWWVILYSLNGERSQDEGHTSITLALDQDVSRHVKVQFEFSFIDQIDKQKSARIRSSEVASLSTGTSCGHHRWMKSGDFEASRHLRDDNFIIRCDLFVATAVGSFAPTPTIEVPKPDVLWQFGDLLQTKLGVDVTFEVGGETFAAHRCVLATRSSVFRAQLFGSMMEVTTSVIHIEDMAPSVFRALLTFIYNDSLPKREVDNMEEDEDEGDTDEDESEEEYDEEDEQVTWLQHLLVAADRYDLPKLKLMCEDELCEHLDVSSVATILDLAEQYHCCRLKEACVQFVRFLSPAKLHILLRTKGWKHIAKTYPDVVNELIVKLASKFY
ncbi:hypothetical protein CFC21_067344 [Triticum aestivum]|uniref:BTB domain-containing protein n=2 Tax=Triticum aestivum TaxID=4565 RepID=A0A9R1H782_WHEAT|nr:BTB/POZ and MATH domain-containing protein 3-like [Triticum aestivum]KAF7060558.1 hypothetical protein CFC21_067344 [Triticum aestivum]